MIEIDRLSKLIEEGLRPDLDEVLEKKKIREWEEKPMVVECLHHNKIIHTNGSMECLRCHKMLKVVEPKWREAKDA